MHGLNSKTVYKQLTFMYKISVQVLLTATRFKPLYLYNLGETVNFFVRKFYGEKTLLILTSFADLKCVLMLLIFAAIYFCACVNVKKCCLKKNEIDTRGI